MIKVTDIAYVRYDAPDLEAMARFLGDFGLYAVAKGADELHMAARPGGPPIHLTRRGPARAVGIGLHAASEHDLLVLAAHAGQAVSDAPGGGRCVRLTDPGGLQVDVVWGRPDAGSPPARESMPANQGGSRPRRNLRVRPTTGPSQVLRLGHVALLVPDFDAARAFYGGLLGLKLSDGYSGPDGKLMGAFLHCARGPEWVDHHTVALIAPPPGIPHTHIDHCAFEVLDLDDLMLGHDHLRARGWKHSWGVGRHFEGSQLFDYWRDPAGHKIEHWTDGDLVNDGYDPQVVPMDPGRMAQWGPPLTPEFFE